MFSGFWVSSRRSDKSRCLLSEGGELRQGEDEEYPVFLFDNEEYWEGYGWDVVVTVIGEERE